MVFCRLCHKNVEDCEHFVPPLGLPAINVFDTKVRTLAYSGDRRILEVAFKTGQVWQLFGVPPGIYKELCDTTISSFLRFIAHRYNARPVRQGRPANERPSVVPKPEPPTVPETEPCPDCSTAMTKRHSTSDGGSFMRVLWECKCGKTLWKGYGRQESRREARRRMH
jgi:hypothetical protein